jgi:hypothetical protein
MRDAGARRAHNHRNAIVGLMRFKVLLIQRY